MLKAATVSATWKVVIESLSTILHVLDKTLHQVAPGRVVNVMLQTQRAAGSWISVRTIRVDWTTAVTIDQALKEQFSRQDATRPRKMEAKKEPPTRLERKPQPSLLAADLDPRLVNDEASNATNREAIIETAEALNPTPDRDMAPRTDILQARGHGPRTQTLKIHIHGVEHHNPRSPLTFD